MMPRIVNIESLEQLKEIIMPTQNPPWANRLINENWQAIASEVKDPTWLPVDAPDSPGGKRKTFSELGCGHYGCVFATYKPGMVFKISTDASEVEFVKTAMKLGEWPTGIVRYMAVLDLVGKHRKRPAFVVWREEAFDVGKIGVGPNPNAEREFKRYHDAYRNAAGYVREVSTRPGFAARLAEARANAEWTWDNVAWEDGLTRVIPRSPKFMIYATSHRLAAALRICAICFELMEHTDYAPDVGSALGFYLDRGILLADVHMQNIGRVTRDKDGYGPQTFIVITDPGHAVFVGIA